MWEYKVGNIGKIVHSVYSWKPWLFTSWDLWQDTGNLAIGCIHSSISAKYLKLNLSLINTTLDGFR